MAKSSQSVESLIKSTFALQVAVRCTEEVEMACRKNNLKFSEMLKPFCALSNNVQMKDVQGHLYTLRNVRVCFSEPPSEPVPESKLRILLGEAVQFASLQADRPVGSLHIGNVSAAVSTPWFEAYRDTYLDFLKQSDHETIKHYVSVLLVVSSTSANPVEEFSQLYTKQKQSEQSKYPKWLLPHIYYYHILLHDVMDGAAHVKSAQENYAQVKAKYGEASSYLLQINSCPGSPSSQHKSGPDIWSQYLRTTHLSSSSRGEDETDSAFRKLHFKRKTAKKNAVPNNAHQDEINLNLSNSGVVRPDQEPRLIASDSETTSSVQPGDDPLSQLAAKTSLPLGEGLNETLPNSLDHNFLNDEELMSLGGGVGGEGVSYGRCLSEDDHRNLRNFVIDLVSKKLLPHLNEVLKNLNEWLLSRRTVRRSFSNMFRGIPKMFGGPNNVVSDETGYASTSLEMQLRQLADVAFLLQSYDLAFQSYHQVKKDFQSSNAWLYYAAAVEMCAVSAYLLSSTRRDVVSYLEEAISVYQLSCKAPFYAIRASLVLVDVLKERGLYKELAQLFIRMTAEDADLRSAVCLEQAAHAFLRSQPSMPRKYSLHLVLAGNRYARAAQRLHSLRTYQQAMELYQGKGWTLAEDYVQFCLAKHSFNLHRLPDAREAFERLLSHEGFQSPSLQRLHLQDYIYVHKQLLLSDSASPNSTQVPLTTPTTSQTHDSGVWGIPLLPLPFINPQLTRVTFTTSPCPERLKQPLSVDSEPSTKTRSSSYREAGQLQATPMGSGLDDLRVETMLSKARSSSTSASGVTTIGRHLQYMDGKSQNTSRNFVVGRQDYDPSECELGVAEWEELERTAAVGVQGSLHENFMPSVQVMDQGTANAHMPFTVVNESVAVGVVLKNPLKGVPLLMTDVCLVWSATPTSTSHAPSSAAVCEVVKRVLLQPEEEKMVTLHITPLREGELEVKGFVFNLCIESSSSSKSSSPLNPGGFRANSLTLSLTSRDGLYQVHQGVGFQSLLAEGVQGRVEFEVRGPRLNSSKVEKGSVVYSKDHRLHWKVTAPMPKIVSVMSGLPSSILTGEMTRVSVELLNVGQVALNSLRITSSLGPHLLLDKVSSDLNHPIYPSTLVSPLDHTPSPAVTSPTTPLSSGTFAPNGCLELPLPQGRLEPGMGVKAHLIMQGASLSLERDTEIPWNIVFYYEPALISANSRLSHRVLRHSCMLHVRESLQLRATAVHGQLPALPTSTHMQRFDMNRLVITLEAENKCQLTNKCSPVEIRLSQLSCISAKWTLEKLDREQGLLCLLPSESGVVHLKGCRLEQPSSGGAGGLVYSDVPLGPTLIPSYSTPVKEMVSGSQAFSSLAVGSGCGQDTGRSGGKGSKSKEQIALVIFWQALVPCGVDTLFSYGHHTITVPLPQSMSALREPSYPASPYDLVKFYLEHPTVYRHRGFVKSDVSSSEGSDVRMCRVPVSIVLQNCHQQPVKVMVELSQPKDGGHQDSRKHSEPSFFWSGGCKRQLKLEGSSTHSLQAFANFCWPAVYNLNTVRVLAATTAEDGSTGNYHLQRWHRTSHISVVVTERASTGMLVNSLAA